jgi:hypothetical protein
VRGRRGARRVWSGASLSDTRANLARSTDTRRCRASPLCVRIGPVRFVCVAGFRTVHQEMCNLYRATGPALHKKQRARGHHGGHRWSDSQPKPLMRLLVYSFPTPQHVSYSGFARACPAAWQTLPLGRPASLREPSRPLMATYRRRARDLHRCHKAPSKRNFTLELRR